MARFKQEFLEENAEEQKLGYLDGFRFGFGFFIAWLVGSSLVGLAVILALAVAHR
jgi:hypothetical protein